MCVMETLHSIRLQSFFFR